MEIDSTPLDVLVVHDDGTVDTVELTGIVDIACDQNTRGSRAAAFDEGGQRRPAPGSGDDPGTDAPGLGGCASHVAVGTSARLAHGAG
ncbi:hypothetical protein ACFWMJ_15340 [Streptomyces hawaiiensis]|uniref:hypothetical protein n=1 Tax=Streptomyces hawaiiensis TaxID=67305 RepID=UPI003664DFFF